VRFHECLQILCGAQPSLPFRKISPLFRFYSRCKRAKYTRHVNLLCCVNLPYSLSTCNNRYFSSWLLQILIQRKRIVCQAPWFPIFRHSRNPDLRKNAWQTREHSRTRSTEYAKRASIWITPWLKTRNALHLHNGRQTLSFLRWRMRAFAPQPAITFPGQKYLVNANKQTAKQRMIERLRFCTNWMESLPGAFDTRQTRQRQW